MSHLLLLAIAILPVVVLLIYIYRQDKYQKEPIKTLIKAFIGGIISVFVDFVIVMLIGTALGDTPIAETVFYSAFLEAGIPEELSKFIIFMLFIWRNKNFDEYFDGIVYATFIGLGFACVENILYVFEHGVATGIARALISVPGHFLFGVVMGYFLSLAKFNPKRRGGYILAGLLLAMLAHGLFDWLLMASDVVDESTGVYFYIIFLVGDIFLWKLGIKYIRKLKENSRIQAEGVATSDGSRPMTSNGSEPEYKQIDWNAGGRQ